MMTLDKPKLYFKQFVTKDTNFRFTVIYKNLANVLVALSRFSYALTCYIMQ